MQIKKNSIDFTPQELANWLEKQPPGAVVHKFPYVCGCTLTTYLNTTTEGLIKSTAHGYAYTDEYGGNFGVEYKLPHFTASLMRLFDQFADCLPSCILTASKALELLNNTEIMRGKK